MANQNADGGNWKGIHWRFIGMTVLAIAVLQVIAQYAVHYPILESLPLAVLIVSYVVIPRVKERRLANALTGVVASYVIGLILECVFDWSEILTAIQKGAVANLLELNVFPILLGLVVAFAYLRLTQWSERKRGQMESKRRAKLGTPEPAPQRRVHSDKYAKKKKKKKSNRR